MRPPNGWRMVPLPSLMLAENAILLTSSLKKCAIASIFAGSATLSCRGFLILLILLSWRYITVVRRLLLQLLRRRVRFALRDLSPIFLLLPLLPSADLFQLYLTSPVRVASFFGVFTALFLRVSYSIGSLGVLGSFSFSPIPVVSIPTLPVFLYIRGVGNPLSPFLAWCFFSWTHGWGVFGLSLILE